MTLSVVANHQSVEEKASALAVIDRLRADVESGAVTCFVGVTIDAEDNVASWSGATVRVSRLRSMGAVSHLLACMHNGEF